MEMAVAGHQFLHLGVGAVDVLGVAGERHPAEGTHAAAEQWPDISRDEAGEIEGVLDADVARHLADVVAVIDGGDARLVEGQHGAHLRRHRGLGRSGHALGIARAPRLPLRDAPARGQIAVDGIMGRGLVGHEIGMRAAAHQLRIDLGGVAEEA